MKFLIISINYLFVFVSLYILLTFNINISDVINLSGTILLNILLVLGLVSLPTHLISSKFNLKNQKQIILALFSSMILGGVYIYVINIPFIFPLFLVGPLLFYIVKNNLYKYKVLSTIILLIGITQFIIFLILSILSK
ncbi:hypothetical protein BTS2_2070 [Bacillus sp. TS-2]|nr:hypothetical protein BTS2_2070 [Bacillus sp. TS-2]